MNIKYRETAKKLPNEIHITMGDQVLPSEAFEKEVRNVIPEERENSEETGIVQEYFQMVYLSSCALRDQGTHPHIFLDSSILSLQYLSSFRSQI